MVHPALAQVIDKVDAVIVKYPTLSQYGTSLARFSVVPASDTSEAAVICVDKGSIPMLKHRFL